MHFALLASRQFGVEKLAKDLYIQEMKQKHFDFQVVSSGFVINPTWPYIGVHLQMELLTVSVVEEWY